jgi:PAS domain S-box-containing protein
LHAGSSEPIHGHSRDGLRRWLHAGADRAFQVGLLAWWPGFARADAGAVPASGAGWAPGILVLLGAAAVGVFAWRRARGSGTGGLAPAPGASRLDAMLEQADCLLWEAEVRADGEDWKWTFKLQPSGLSPRLFGNRALKDVARLWDEVEVPERPEMDRRCGDALREGLPGYEQSFRVVKPDRVLWLRESVSIVKLSPGCFWLVGLVTDITAQRQAEAARAASEEQLHDLLAHANCMLWEAHVTRDRDDIFHWTWFVPKSQLFRRVAGEDPNSSPSMPWGRMTVPEYDEIEIRSRDAMRRGLPGYEQEFHVVLGQEVLSMHEQVSITLVAADHWQLKGVVIDITAQRRAEEAQQKSAARLQQILEQADCTIWSGQAVKLGDGNLQWTLFVPPSRLYRRIFGMDSSEEKGFLWREIGVPEYDQMMVTSRAALYSGAPGYEQIFHVPKQGGDVWLTEQVSINPAGPDRWDVVGIITDITARREAEEARRTSEAQLAQILELADCMVWQASVTHGSNDSLLWSLYTPRSVLYRRLFGESTPAGLLDWSALDVPERAEMDRRSREAIRGGASGYEQEFRVIQLRRVVWLHEVVTITRLAQDKARLVGVITDITARREAEEARRASEEQVEQILGSADCLLWQARVFELAPKELRWVQFIPRSRLYREVFGSDPGEQAALDWVSVVDPATIREIDQRAAGALVAGAPGYEQEFRAQRDDRVFWLHEQVSISRVRPGEWRLAGVITDVTARRDAEQAVRASEVRYRSLFQHMPVAIIEADFSEVGRWLGEVRASGVSDLARWLDEDPHRTSHGAKLVRISNSNDTARNILRMKSASDFRRRSGILATADTLRMVRSALVAIWEGRNTLEDQIEMRDFEGGRHFMNVRWWVGLTEAGMDLSESVVVFVDLTDLKQAEAALAAEKERLAVTLRAMAEGVVTTDVAGRVQFMNPAAEALLQWDASAIGRPVTEVCRLENNRTGAGVDLPVALVTQGGKVADLPAHTRLVTPKGAQRIVEGCCAPIHSTDRHVTGTVLVFRDVTEQERLEQELVRATRLESVGVLAGGIAHDFNNILTAVMGNLALAALDVATGSAAAAQLKAAEQAALRARDLTQQLLTYAKGGEPVRTTVHLEAVVKEMTGFSLLGSNVTAVFDLPDGLWAADADKGQIGRVVQNLVINSVQAMPGGGTLRISMRNDKVAASGRPGLIPGDYVQLAVADPGEGIRSEHLARIFDPYFTTKAGGSGLGLAAVYSIIKKHQGHIEVESEVGAGTTFRVWLPALHEVPPAPRLPAPAQEAPLRGRVLFMDDEKIIRQMAELLLGRLGLDVECAADGAEAVEKYRKARAAGNPFSAVVMDLTVPGGMGGLEAVARLREIDPEVRAIVSSGYSSDPVLAKYRAHGFCGVIAKPYQMDDFTRVLRAALSGGPAATS